MEKQQSYRKDLELRSNEVQEVMNRIPIRLIRTGMTAICSILLIIVVGCAFFPSPEIVSSPFFIKTIPLSKVIKSKTDGRISQILVNDGDLVKKGQVILCMEGNAKYEEILEIINNIKNWEKEGCRLPDLFYVVSPEYQCLGVLEEEYDNLRLLWRQYINDPITTTPNSVIASLQNLKRSIEEYINNNYIVSSEEGFVRFVYPFHNGDNITSGMDLVTVIPKNIESYQAFFTIDKQDYRSSIKVGQQVLLKFDEEEEKNEKIANVSISFISPMTDSRENIIICADLSKEVLNELELQLDSRDIKSGIASITTNNQSLLSKILNIRHE